MRPRGHALTSAGPFGEATAIGPSEQTGGGYLGCVAEPHTRACEAGTTTSLASSLVSLLQSLSSAPEVEPNEQNPE